MSSNHVGTGTGRDWFATMAVAYLVLPCVIFLLTWVRTPVGVPAALVVLATYGLFLHQGGTSQLRPNLSKGTWALILLFGFVFTLAAGIGGFVPQTLDYEKHNLAFHDLMEQSWPVYYVNGTQTNYLCYGLGYYLPPALAARIMGANGLPVATFVWGYTGVILFFYWVATFAGPSKKALCIVLLFAGTETIWHTFLHLLQTPLWGDAGHSIFVSLGHMGMVPDFSDNYSALQWRPQHVIPAWLGTALFYDMFWVRNGPRGAGFVWTACWLWSPLMCLGLLIVPLVALKRWRWRDALEPVNFGAVVLMAVLAVYFQGHLALAERGPIWKFCTGGNWLILYLWFLVAQLGPMFLIYLADRKYNLLGDLRPLFRCSLIVLVLLPLYKIGYYGDQRLQIQTPLLVFCGLAACRIFLHAGFTLKRPLFVLLAASQILGAAYPCGKWWQKALTSERADYSYAVTRQNWGCENLSEFKRFGNDYAVQYLGRTNSIAAGWLLRPVH